MMEDTIISVNTLKQQLYRRFQSNRVHIHEENGIVTLTPIENSQDDGLNDYESITQKRLAFMGCMEGEFWMSDDFDDPIEEMREYM